MGSGGLGAHDCIGFTMIGAALGMADDDGGGAGFLQHLSGDVAGMGAACGWRGNPGLQTGVFRPGRLPP